MYRILKVSYWQQFETYPEPTRKVSEMYIAVQSADEITIISYGLSDEVQLSDHVSDQIKAALKAVERIGGSTVTSWDVREVDGEPVFDPGT